ncbi:3896_t:CDS:10 [Cetraspora pellucida]|uniref:3896_t:CDS:1 n=1 Tax=Cetraspora pellucida TaxID=1433469 RepID=A0A9N8ZTS7_9GLOM|nr:3896_t:CDS:10 [Cetraspora pellucida]
MEPSRYSVLIVDRSCNERTYHASQLSNSEDSRTLSLSYLAACGDGCICEGNKQNVDDLVKIFLSIFSEVTTVPSGRKALSILRRRTVGCPPTILIIDIDHTEGVSRDLYARKNSFVAPDSLHSINLAEITTTSDTLYGLEFLNHITKEISQGMLDQVIPIVCSWKDSFDVITDCINKGATDYLIKPIRPEVAKTIFLNAHRFSGNKYPISLIDYRRPAIRNSCSFEQRLEEVFKKENWLAKAIIEYYAPPEPIIKIPFTPRLNQAAELERRNLLKKKLSEWDFNPHQLSEDDLLECVFIIFDHVMMIDDLKELCVPSDQLHRLLVAIRQSYYDTNPYHNFTHAVDVLQAMFYFLYKMEIIPPLFSSKRQSINVNQQRCRPNDLLTVTDAFALLLASIGHDVEFRKVMVNAILATDMSLHNDYVTKIKDEIKRFESSDTMFDSQPMIERAASWSKVLLEEFRCQGDLERKLGLPILPINDRNGKTTQSESQIGFIDYFAMPLFKCVGDLIHEMKFCIPYLEQNKKTWQERKDNGTLSLNNKNSVSFDNRKNSPISTVPPARTTSHQLSGTSYLPQIPNLTDGSEVDEWFKSNDILSTTGASDSPLNSRYDNQKTSSWQMFSRNNQSLSNTVYASTYTSTDNVSNQNDLNNHTTICCCIQ